MQMKSPYVGQEKKTDDMTTSQIGSSVEKKSH